MSRYWYDSFPGIDLSGVVHPTLDFYGTPCFGVEHPSHKVLGPYKTALDAFRDGHAYYTTVSQNRGGIA